VGGVGVGFSSAPLNDTRLECSLSVDTKILSPYLNIVHVLDDEEISIYFEDDCQFQALKSACFQSEPNVSRDDMADSSDHVS